MASYTPTARTSSTAKATALNLRGTSLGNWIVPEGYMFRFEKGPQSGREIDALFNELIGPADAAQILA